MLFVTFVSSWFCSDKPLASHCLALSLNRCTALVEVGSVARTTYNSSRFNFPLPGRIGLGSTRCVLVQGGASPTRTVSPSPIELSPLPFSLCWPTPSFNGISAGAAGADGPVFSSGASSIDWKLARFKPNPLMDHA